eukprot:3366427-Pleurochrysis_carterae.AAC.3
MPHTPVDATAARRLERQIGAPSPNVDLGMKAEHESAIDSDCEFVTSNYGIVTTARIELQFVLSPETRATAWPAEDRSRIATEHMRKSVPLTTVASVVESTNRRLQRLGQPELLIAEACGARLCAHRRTTT